MKPDLEKTFMELEPPPGGVERFRQRIESRDDAAHAPLGRYVVAGLAVSVLAVAVIGLRQPMGPAEPQVADVFQGPAFDRLLGRPMERATLSVSINDQPVNVIVTTSADSRIRIYSVESD